MHVCHFSAEVLHRSMYPHSPPTRHTMFATQMTLAHNGILQGLKSIYLQATHIPREDLGAIRDFLTYCQCWCESMHYHHDAEEKDFFPSIELISDVRGIMKRNIEQHRAFTPGFDLFQECSRTCLPKTMMDERSGASSNRPPRVWNLRQELQRRRARLPVCTIFRALSYSLLLC